jgi:phosphoribosylformylglycinamidine (FGAM) synthase PurS component
VVADALLSLGYSDVTDVRQGKFFDLELSDTVPTRRRRE